MEEMNEKESIIKLIQGLHTVHKKVISFSYYQKLSELLPYPPPNKVLELFHSWTDLLEEAGVLVTKEISINHRNKLNKPRKVIKEKMTVQQSLEYYVRMCGDSVTVREYEKIRRENPKMVSSNTVINRFGTWQQALKEHGMRSKKRYSIEACIFYLELSKKELGTHFNSNSYAKWARKNQAPALRTVLNKVGNWSDVKKILESREKSLSLN